MSEFFNFKWGKAGDERALIAKQYLATGDDSYAVAISGVLIAATVTARGKKRSPSSPLETLQQSQRRTNDFIKDQMREAWCHILDQNAETTDHYDALLSLINPRMRNRTGISPQLNTALVSTYESILDYWVVMADMITGFGSISEKVFGVKDKAKIGEYLVHGITRSQLLQKFGHELNDTEGT